MIDTNVNESIEVQFIESKIINVGDLRKIIKGLKDHVELHVRGENGHNICCVQSIYYESAEFLDDGQTVTRPVLNFMLAGKKR